MDTRFIPREDLRGLMLDDIVSLAIYYSREADDWEIKAFKCKIGGDKFEEHMKRSAIYKRKSDRVWAVIREIEDEERRQKKFKEDN